MPETNSSLLSSGGPARWIVAVLVAVQLATGVALLVLHLGVVPLYGDTPEYLQSADTGRVGAGRGVLYPHLLAVAARVAGTPRRPEYPGWRRAFDRDRDLMQVVQLTVYAASLAYFLWAVVAAPLAAPLGRLRFALLLALLWLDPLGLHHSISIVTDSLALSASLVFCAAFVDLVRGRLPGWIPATLLLSSAFVATGLRLEKGPVIFVTAGVSVAAYGWLTRRGWGPRHVTRRAITAAAIAIAAVGLGQWAQMGLSEPPTIPLVDVILTQRVVYPHLGEVYDELSDAARIRLGRSQAERFDRSIQQARRVLDEATGGDPTLRHALLLEMAQCVLASRGLALGTDVVKDAFENVFPTAAFHARVAMLLALGESEFKDRFRGDGVQAAYQRMTLPMPRLMPIHIASSVALIVAACAASLARFGRRPWSAGTGSEVASRWLPAVVFVLTNAAAFALLQDLVNVRYTLFAHIIFLAAAYNAMLRWAFSSAAR